MKIENKTIIVTGHLNSSNTVEYCFNDDERRRERKDECIIFEPTYQANGHASIMRGTINNPNHYT